MTYREKQNLIEQLTALIASLPTDDVEKNSEAVKSDEKIELLTIKEAAQEISGLSECTIRQLVAQGKIASVRSGAGKRGKILIPKSALTAYFKGGAV